MNNKTVDLVGLRRFRDKSQNLLFTPSTNLADFSKKQVGYYINELNGEPTANANHTMIQWIPVNPSTQYIMGLADEEDGSYGNYVINKGVRIAQYELDGTFVSAFICDSLGENVFITGSATYYLCISWNSSDTYVLKPMIANGNELPTYQDYFEQLKPSLIDAFTKHEIGYQFDILNSPFNPFSQTRGTLSDGTLSIAENSSVKKNLMLSFVGDISSFSKIVVGYRHLYSGNLWNRIEIDTTNVVVKALNNDIVETNAHGLTIENNIQVLIKKNYNLTADITIISNGNSFTKNVPWYDVTQSVQPFVQSSGSSLTNCVFTLTYADRNKKIYAFGDSYFNYSPSRWVYYANEQGFTKNMLLNGYPGEASFVGPGSDIESILKHGTPKFLLWCLGMNDGSDTNDAPNTQWKTGIDYVLSVCEEKGIIPILATIPTVPNVNNEKKNEWVRASGYRYIDFAKAVGANSSGVWYSGMLSNDNLHPTEQGAKALFMQAINDFPEMMLEN